eukprot:g19928.t1
MTMGKFLNAMSCESKYGRVLTTATARNTINHVKTYRLLITETGCEASKLEEWAAEIIADATSLNVGPMDNVRGQQVSKPQFLAMKQSAKLKARLEGLKYEDLPEDEVK